MNSLISINYKFMSISPKRLIELVLESKYTKGVEVYVDIKNQNELKYLDDIVYELKKNNLILQIHGEIQEEFDKELNFIKKIEQYSDYLNMPIIFTLHTMYDEDKNISIDKTINYVSNLIKEIDNDKIIMCLENLNDSREQIRLGKDEIKTTILNDEKVFFTYDIGHELADYGEIINLDKFIIEEIRNIHIHSNDNKGNDHLPIYMNDIHWNEIIKSLIFLQVNNYKNNIVYEYALELCKGDTVEEKIKDYLESIDFVSERYVNI